MMVTVMAPANLELPPADPPAGCEDELMWRTAYTMFADHEPHPCLICAAGGRCEARWLASAGLATAMGETRLLSDYWRGLIAIRRLDLKPLGNRRRFEHEWFSQQFEKETISATLGRRDIGKLFRFLRSRGWSINYLAGATGISETGVRAICRGRRQVMNYDVLVRICEGLGIPFPLMGLGRQTGR